MGRGERVWDGERREGCGMGRGERVVGREECEGGRGGREGPRYSM